MRETPDRTPCPAAWKGFLMTRGLRHVAVVVALGLVVAACSAAGGAAPSSPAATDSARPAPLASAPAASAPAAPVASTVPAASYPLTLVDDEGSKLTLPAAPARVVSLTPAVTETVFALGQGAKLVGRTSSDDYPAAAKKVAAVATYNGVEIEKVVALRPDLVIAGGNGLTPAKDIARMRSLGMPVLVVDPRSLDGVLADLRLVGQAIGAEAAADGLAEAAAARVAQIQAAAAGLGSRPRTFYEVDATKEIYGPARDSFLAQLIQLAGGDPVTSGDPSVWSISLERLVSANPQVIVLGDANYGTKPSDVKTRAGWGALSAVRDGAIRPIDDTIVTRPGPRIAEGLAALAQAIHPDLALPPAPSPAATTP
jgi:iron complex transport system substrate-binding protein